ncbi:MAG: hypothetical protein HY717_11515 [Planctomycetes bacterium]|nr:hypothetical protein [Planctomycetota bacterium]
MKALKTVHSRCSITEASLLGLLLWSCLAPPAAEAALSEHDKRFAEYLIQDLKYFDTAQRFLESLKKIYAGAGEKGEIAFFEADILQHVGKTEEYLKKLNEAGKLDPQSKRAMTSSLLKINVDMGKVITAFEKANQTSDPKNSAVFRKEARKYFQEKVLKPINALIDDLGKKVAGQEQKFREDRKKNPKTREPEQLIDLSRSRNLAELARVKIYLVYAKQLPRDDPSFQADQEKMLKDGLKYASEFVDNRPEFYLMQYDAQLRKGLYQMELGKFAAAAEDLSVLIGIEPPGAPPPGGYPKEILRPLIDLQLQALLYSARSANLARKHAEAVAIVEEKLLKGKNNPLREASRDPELEKYFVLSELELAIAHAGRGSSEKGLQMVQDLIARYSKLSTSPQASAYITDARKALGTIARIGGVALRAQDYYQGGIGLYAEGKLEESLGLFQQALGALADFNERNDLAPQCLEKIGWIHLKGQRFAEAALSYLEICRQYPRSELVTTAAVNALSSANKLTIAAKDHSGYRKLDEEAKRHYDHFVGKGIAIFQVTMVEAQDLERQGKWEAAKELYLKIPREQGKDKVPFYYRAQASAGHCEYQGWLARRGSGDQSAEELKKLARRMKALAAAALKEKQLDGAILASYVEGLIHNDLKEWPEAVAALSPFTGLFKEDKSYRSIALYHHCEALLRQGKVAEAEEAFKQLKKDFENDASSLYAALLFVDHFNAQGGEESFKKAAAYVKIYANHFMAKDELKDLQKVLFVVEVLVQGGEIAEADKFLKMAERIGGGDEEVGKRVLYYRAFIAFQLKKHAEVIQATSDFIARYKPSGEDRDDPYIYRLRGESYIKLKAPPQITEVKKAEEDYNSAVGLLDRQRQAVAARGGENGKLEREYWEWAHEWSLLNQHLGKAGDINAWRKMWVFVNERQGSEMGGAALKEKFLELKKEAEKYFSKKK